MEGRLLIGCLVLILGLAVATPHMGADRSSTVVPGLHVSGNQLVDQSGAAVVLHGANRSGSEYICPHSLTFTDGPTDRASLEAMKSWGLDVVRVPLNEDCWLGINGATLGGGAYQAAVRAYVKTIEAAGMYAILDLHYSAPGTTLATGQQPMPDADHSAAFWRGVAVVFGADDRVIFDLFNEPYPRDGAGEAAEWACWRDGCQETSGQGISYRALGMAALVRAVRGEGATNVLMLGGIRHAGETGHWADWVPPDPLHNLVVSQHFYYRGACSSDVCRAGTVALARRFPVIAGEVGDTDCSINNTGWLLAFLAAHRISYVGWNWGTNFGCQSLVSSYTGTPTQPYGQFFHDAVLRAEGRTVVPGPLSSFFNNVGVVADAQMAPCALDQIGSCYSQEALASLGVAPGRAIPYNGARFVWASPSGVPDNVQVAGQTVAISPTVAGAVTLNVLGASTGGAAMGPVTLTYTDGTVITATLGLSDWTLNSGANQPAYGNVILVRAPYFARKDGFKQHGTAFLFATAIPLDRHRTLASMRLPVLPPADVGPQQHVFALSVTPP